MTDVTIPVTDRWVRFARSPLAVVARMMTGVAGSFAPWHLYEYGQGAEPLGPPWFGMTLSWAVIVVCLLFHATLSSHVIAEIRRARG